MRKSGKMKITKRQLRRIVNEAYNSMSPRSKSLANAAKRQFAKDYPDAQVGIDGREGWITVNDKKAVNMSQASGSPLSMDDIIDQMKQAYLGHPMSSQEVPESEYSPEEEDEIRKSILGSMTKNPPHTPWRKPGLGESKKMKITKRQLRRIIKEEKRKLLREGQAQEETLFDALEQYVMVLDEEMGYDVPRDQLKAEVLNFVDGYFLQTEEPPGGWDS